MNTIRFRNRTHFLTFEFVQLTIDNCNQSDPKFDHHMLYKHPRGTSVFRVN